MSDLFLRPLFTWRSAVASQYGPGSPVTRHVLLTLSLHMNEKGESCFPSIATLVEETNLSERAVKFHLRQAQTDGWIGKRDMRLSNGQGWRRVEYFAVIPSAIEAAFHMEQRGAHPAPRQGGAPTAPRQGGAPDSKGGAPEGKKVVHHVHTSNSINSSRNSSKSGPRFWVEILPDWVPVDAWIAWCEMRASLKPPKPLATEKAAKLAVAKLERFRASGFDPRAVLENSTINSYQGLFEPKGGRAQAAPAVPACEYRGPNDDLEPCGMPGAKPSPLYGGRKLCPHHLTTLEKPVVRTQMPASARDVLSGLGLVRQPVSES